MHAFDRQTDRQTDGQTDGQTDRNLIVKTALYSMQRGKKPPFYVFKRTYGAHLRLTGKRVVYFLLVLIELVRIVFQAAGSTSEYRFKHAN